MITRMLFGLIFLLAAAPAFAAPFLICDPYTAGQVDYFKVTMDAAPTVNSPIYQVPSTSQYILHYDVAAISVGSHTVKVRACKAASVWYAEACSVEVPFAFARPAAPPVPPDVTGIGLASQ